MTDLTNQQIAKDEGKKGFGQIGSAFISTIMATYIINQASLHGVNFELLGISSELVKSSMEGLLISGLVWATPSHFIAAIVDAIVFIKTSWKQIASAWNSH